MMIEIFFGLIKKNLNNYLMQNIMHKMFLFKCRNNFQIFNKAENLQNQLASAIEDKKQKCNSRISKMLMDPLTSVKIC